MKAAKEKQKITYKGIPIRLSADFSAETLQASKDLIQIQWRNQKLFRQAKAKRIQHHQTSFTTNAKGTLGGNTREEKDPQKQTQNN